MLTANTCQVLAVMAFQPVGSAALTVRCSSDWMLPGLPAASRSDQQSCYAAAGAPLPGQINILRNGCDIAVGTPGRVQDLMQRSGSLKLDKIR